MSKKNLMSQSKTGLQKGKSESLLKYNLNKQFISSILAGLEMANREVILKNKIKHVLQQKPIAKKNICPAYILSRQSQNNHIIRMRKFYLNKSMAVIKAFENDNKIITPYNVPSRYRNIAPVQCLHIAAKSSLRLDNKSVRNDYSNNSFKKKVSQNIIKTWSQNSSVKFSYQNSNRCSAAKERFERSNPISSVSFFKSKNIVQKTPSGDNENEMSKINISFTSSSKNDIFSDVDNVNTNVEKLIQKINVSEQMETLIKRTEELYKSMEDILFRMNHGDFEPVIKPSKQLSDKQDKTIKNYMLIQNDSNISVSETDTKITESEYLPTVEESGQEDEEYDFSDIDSDENEEENSDIPTETYTYDHKDDGRYTNIRFLNMQNNMPRNISLNNINNDLIYTTPETLNRNCIAFETRPTEHITINQASVEPTLNLEHPETFKGLCKFMTNNPHFSNQNYYTSETSNGFMRTNPIIESFQPTQKENFAGQPNNVYYSQNFNRGYLQSKIFNADIHNSVRDSRESIDNITFAPNKLFVPQARNGYVIKPYRIMENKQLVEPWTNNPSLPTQRISRETNNNNKLLREFINSLPPVIKTANVNLNIQSLNNNNDDDRDVYISDVSYPHLTKNNKGDPSGRGLRQNDKEHDEQNDKF